MVTLSVVVFLRFSLMAEHLHNHSRERKKNLDDSNGDIILHSRIVEQQKRELQGLVMNIFVSHEYL